MSCFMSRGVLSAEDVSVRLERLQAASVNRQSTTMRAFRSCMNSLVVTGISGVVSPVLGAWPRELLGGDDGVQDRLEDLEPLRAAHDVFARTLRVRHHPDHVAPFIADARDVLART